MCPHFRFGWICVLSPQNRLEDSGVVYFESRCATLPKIVHQTKESAVGRVDGILAIVAFLLGMFWEGFIGTGVVWAGYAALSINIFVIVVVFGIICMQTIRSLRQDKMRARATLNFLLRQRDVWLNFGYLFFTLCGPLLLVLSSAPGQSYSEVNLAAVATGALCMIIVSIVKPPELKPPQMEY
jgi:hypothetical protein